MNVQELKGVIASILEDVAQLEEAIKEEAPTTPLIQGMHGKAKTVSCEIEDLTLSEEHELIERYRLLNTQFDEVQIGKDKLKACADMRTSLQSVITFIDSKI